MWDDIVRLLLAQGLPGLIIIVLGWGYYHERNSRDADRQYFQKRVDELQEKRVAGTEIIAAALANSTNAINESTIATEASTRVIESLIRFPPSQRGRQA